MRLAISTLLLTALHLTTLDSFVDAQIDKTWTITANGLTIQANPDGSFRIPNVPAVDVSPVDFVGDNPLRITGVRAVNGKTEYLFSEFFTIRQRETVIVPNVTVTDIPPRTPESLRIGFEEGSSPVLTQIGATSQLRVLAGFEGADELEDVTPKERWTSYRSSDSQIVSVTEGGLITARQRGLVFLSAVNEGAVATIRVSVALGVLSSVEGNVALTDGRPLSNAEIRANVGSVTLSDELGHFQFSNVPTEFGAVSMSVHGVLDEASVTGCFGPFDILPAGITDVGILKVDIPKPALIHWWTADGVPDDVVGSLHSTMSNVGFAPGVVCEAFDFSASGSYARIPNASDIDFTQTDAYTICLWMRSPPQVEGSTPSLVEKWNQSGPYPYVIRLSLSAPGKVFAACYDLVNSPGAASERRVDDGQFHHIAGVFDHPNRAIRLYVDGRLEGSSEYDRLGDIANGQPLFLGHRGNLRASSHFSGQLDEVQIFSRPLTDSEVMDLFERETK